MQERKTNNQRNQYKYKELGMVGGSTQGAEGEGGSQNYLQRLEGDVKDSVFNVMFLILRESDIQFYKYTCLLVIEFLQVLQFAFSKSMKEPWKSDSVFYYVSSFLSFTHIVPWMSFINVESYIVIFYLCVSVVLCTLLALTYVSYSQNKPKKAYVWPLRLLREACFIVPTVLFIPFLEMLTSMLVCQSSQAGNSFQLYLFPDLKCWSGIHILHATVSIAFSLVLLGFTFLTSITFFKSLQTSTDFSAKSDSGPDLQLQIQKTVLIYSFTFFYDNEQEWFLVAVSIILSALTYQRYLRVRCYYDDLVQKVHLILRALTLWSSFALFLSKLLQNTGFNGGIQLWFLGLPLVAGLIYFQKDDRYSQLLINTSNIQQGEDLANQIRYFLQVLHQRDLGNRNAEIQIKGYVYTHEETCPNQQCQLKQYKRNVIMQTQGKGRLKNVNRVGLTQSNRDHLMMLQKQDNNQLLKQHAQNMFRMAIQKFPNSGSLRILYAFFLIEKLGKKEEALQELTYAESLKPTFQEQFIIFRHKKLIEEFNSDSMQTNQSGSGQPKDTIGLSSTGVNQNAVDIMTRFAFESSFRQLQVQIERCTSFHIEFWNYLKVDRPDLQKLGDCGSRIKRSISTLEQIWREMQKLDSNVPKALKLYGRFLLEILHDNEMGQEYLQKAKDVSNMKRNMAMGNFDESMNLMQISSDGTPCIVVSGEPDKVGLITQCNQGAVRVFGYEMHELKNQKVEKIMPELYAKHHQKILEESLSKGFDNMGNKERFIFAKHKSGYVFPVWIQLKLIQTTSNEVQFIALFKIEKKMMNANIGYIIFNKEKKINGISSSCMKMMGLDVTLVRRMLAVNYDLTRLSPDLEDHREELASSKLPMVLEWIIPHFSKKKWPKAQVMEKLQRKVTQSQFTMHLDKGGGESGGMNSQQSRFKTDQSRISQVIKKKFKFLCTSTQINMGPFSEIGHFIKLEKLKKQTHNNEERGPNSHLSQDTALSPKRRHLDKVKVPQFQFRFDFYTGRFVREIRESTAQFINKNPAFLADEDKLLNQSTTEDSNNAFESEKPTQLLLAKTIAEMDGPIKSPADYGYSDVVNDPENMTYEELLHRMRIWRKGIQIYTLRDDRVKLKDYADEEKRQMEIDQQRRKQMEEENRKIHSLTALSNTIRTKKALVAALNDKVVPQAIKNLRLTMNLLILGLIGLAISEFTVISDQFQQINSNYDMIQKSYLQISEIQRVSYDVRTIILITNGTLTSYKDYIIPQVNFVTYLQTDIITALQSIYDLQDYISLSQLPLSDPHNALFNTKMVPMYYIEANNYLQIINFTLTEAVLQMSSAIFTVSHLQSGQYLENDEDIFFVMYNSFNNFLQALFQSSGYYEQELYDRANQKNNILLILFLCSIGTVLLSIPILIPAIYSVNQAKDKVLALFVDIPSSYIIELGLKSESFFSSLYSDQQEESKSQDSASETNGDQDFQDLYSHGQTKRTLVKQPKNSSNTTLTIFFKYLVGVLLVIGYFTSMFIVAKTYISNVQVFTDELSVSAKIEANLTFLLNVQREMINNPDRPILNQNSFNISRHNLHEIYENVQLYMLRHQDDRNVLSQTYKDTFEAILVSNLCDSPYINQTLLPVPCSQLFNEAPTHGLQSVIITYFEQLRFTLNTYANFTSTVPSSGNGKLPKRELASNQTTVQGNQTTQPKISRVPKAANTTTQTNLTANSSNNQTNNPSVNISVIAGPSQPKNPPVAPAVQTNVSSAARLALLNGISYKQLYWMQFRFLQGSFRTLVQTLTTDANSNFQSTINTKMAVFIVFMIAVVLSYLLVWIPFVTKLNRDIQRTKLMLTMIPIKIILKIPKIQEYLNNQTGNAITATSQKPKNTSKQPKVSEAS